MSGVPSAAAALSARLRELGWVRDLLVAGSLATGDYTAGVSDLDLVAIVDGPVDVARTAALVAVHRALDGRAAAGADLGCVYVDEGRLFEQGAPHPTWTHGRLVHRVLSGVTRVELVCHGFALFGRSPTALLPAATEQRIRSAARDELCGYWAWASRRPWMWLDPALADLGLSSMARARHAMQTAELITKSRALEQAEAPSWLVEQVMARRRGEAVVSPRLRTAWFAWRDSRETVRAGCHGAV